jgi:hypothetical protein
LSVRWANHVGKNQEEVLVHHFLFYYPWQEDPTWSLVTQRYVPEGVPLDNDLPTKHIFHVNHQGSYALLYKLVIGDLGQPEEASDNILLEIADRIEESEKKAAAVVGGVGLSLGLITGPGAFIGGLAGALATKAGAVTGKIVSRRLGNAWKKRQEDKNAARARKAAAKQVRRSESLVNPVLEVIRLAIDSRDHLTAAEAIETQLADLGLSARTATKTAVWQAYGNGEFTMDEAPWLYFCRPDGLA